MTAYVRQSYLKKKVSYQSQKYSRKITALNINLIHKLFDSINISLIVLISILFFLSLDSQRQWSNTYRTLSRTKAMNNNLIDYISKIEEFYVSKLDSSKKF